MTERRRAALSVRGLELSYDGHPLLRDLDLDVGPHEVVALLGPSGAGKSSLLRVIAGLLPPDVGTVCWDGEDLRERRLTFGVSAWSFRTRSCSPTST